MTFDNAQTYTLTHTHTHTHTHSHTLSLSHTHTHTHTIPVEQRVMIMVADHTGVGPRENHSSPSSVSDESPVIRKRDEYLKE